jgi:hypothetical protein
VKGWVFAVLITVSVGFQVAAFCGRFISNELGVAVLVLCIPSVLAVRYWLGDVI